MFSFAFDPKCICFLYCPAKQVKHQNLWKWLAQNPITIVFWYFYTNVDGIKYAVNDRQQVPPHLFFARPRAKLYVTMKYDFKRYDARIKIIPCHSSYPWIFEVSTMSP